MRANMSNCAVILEGQQFEGIDSRFVVLGIKLRNGKKTDAGRMVVRGADGC